MDELLRYWILKKLIRKGYWSRRPINFDDLKHPKYSKRAIESECKEMVKERLLIMKPGLRGMRFGLNARNQRSVLNEYEKLKKKYGIKRV